MRIELENKNKNILIPIITQLIFNDVNCQR